ncbi:nucleotide pyrophosphohydrolase [Chitinimonas sp.]|uniref:nucleotide pyrophosphohydrolase n=1 Tax=Chitinimonas sp. TaxID=1934313 RepID=UPI002F94310B
MDSKGLQSRLAAFAAERDWEQFHNPKNLVMALSVECAELVEEFQWLSEAEAADAMAHPERAQRIREELADVTAYLLRIADKLGVDLEAALLDKMAKNAEKYPVDAFKGSARKYNR